MRLTVLATGLVCALELAPAVASALPPEPMPIAGRWPAMGAVDPIPCGGDGLLPAGFGWTDDGAATDWSAPGLACVGLSIEPPVFAEDTAAAVAATAPAAPRRDVPVPGLGAALGVESDALDDPYAGRVTGVSITLRDLVVPDLAIFARAADLRGSQGTARLDVRPLLAGARVYLFGDSLRPYVGVAAGIEQSRLDLGGGATTQATRSFLARAGVGLAVDIGPRVSLLAEIDWQRARVSATDTNAVSGGPGIKGAAGRPDPALGDGHTLIESLSLACTF